MDRLAFGYGGRTHPREQPHLVIHSDAAGRPPRAPPQAGQICDVPVEADGAPERKRNSSISYASNGKYYRVSVKRKAAGQGGPRFLHGDI